MPLPPVINLSGFRLYKAFKRKIAQCGKGILIYDPAIIADYFQVFGILNSATAVRRVFVTAL